MTLVLIAFAFIRVICDSIGCSRHIIATLLPTQLFLRFVQVADGSFLVLFYQVTEGNV
jgi:hypothetical protein